MAVAAEVAVRNALATYLQARLSLSVDACQPDWYPATEELPRPVAVSIHDAGAVAPSADNGTPALLSMTPGAGVTATALYRLGELKIPLAIDVWCSTQKERDDLIERIDDALNQPPSVSGEPVANALAGLTLTCGADEYFSAVVTYDSDDHSAFSTPEGTAREEWRAVFQVSARVDHLRQRTVTRQTAMTAELSVGPSVDPSSSGGADTIEIFTGG